MKKIDILIFSASLFLIACTVYIINSMLDYNKLSYKVDEIHSYIEDLKVDGVTIYSE